MPLPRSLTPAAMCTILDKHIHVLVSDVSSQCIYTLQTCIFLPKSQTLGLDDEGKVSQQLGITLRMLEVVPGLAWNSHEWINYLSWLWEEYSHKQTAFHSKPPESAICVCGHTCGTWKTGTQLGGAAESLDAGTEWVLWRCFHVFVEVKHALVFCKASPGCRQER